MTAQVLSLRRPLRLECSKCGVGADAACDCGAPYIPVGDLAAKVAAANPDKSARALAAETGIARRTIDRARQRSGGSNDPPEKRVGLDGKSYPAAKPQEKPGAEKARLDDPRLDEDFLSPDDADKGLALMADRLDSGLFLPSEGILASLKEAMGRADDRVRKVIEEAAYTLSELVRRDK